MTKIMIKLLNEENDRIEWVHLCYADETLYNKFLESKGLLTTDMNEVLSRWAKEDFNVNLALSRRADLTVLRAIIKDFYKTAFPAIYMDSNTDRQGWFRVWVTKKLREELGIYGNESI